MAPAASSSPQHVRRSIALQPCLAAGVATAAAEAGQQAAITVRRFRPSDQPQVVEICRNVYGGTDILPERINGDAARPDTHVLVAAAADDDSVAALLCCQQRGDVLWLYGARTREDMRCRGLAELLLAEAEALARSLPGVAALLSVTVPNNGTMRRIFARRALHQLCQVVSWPPYVVAREVHAQLAQPPAAAERQHERPASLLDALPGAAAVLRNGRAQQLLPLWRRCQTREELEAVLLQLRQQRVSAATAALPAQATNAQQEVAASPQQPCAASHALHWLPEEFELLPAGSPQADELIRQGRVWVLPPGAATTAAREAARHPQGGQHQQQQEAEQQQAEQGVEQQLEMPAVLALHGPGVWGMRHAGVVAAGQAALESALLLATEADPHCCCFYVDRCERFDHDVLWRSVDGDRLDVLPHWKLL